MKLTTRGFTLVELMIVIAIIGVLAAALFPAMSGYLSRSRDTARVSHVGQLITASSTFFQDNETYNGAINGTCVNSGQLNKYMGGKTPTNGAATHCATEVGAYGAGSGTIGGAQAIAISAVLENKGTANTGVITSYQGTPAALLDTVGSFVKNPPGVTTATGGYVVAR